MVGVRACGPRAQVNYFNGAVVRANLLRPQGPAYLLDMHHITQGTAKGT